jgi:exonuclease SbcC
MHLNRLVLHNFKKYRHAEVDFQDGLTGILGNNGSGKSTIVEAIAWALYGNKVSTVKRDYIKNIRAGDSENVEVRLSLSLGKNELLISRSMRGRSMLAEASLSLDGRMVAVGSKEVDQKLEEILKISFQDFMRTFYARQKDLDNLLKEGGAGKREYLLKLLGLDEIRERAIERMKADAGALRDDEIRLRGALEELGDVENRLEEVEASISIATAEHAQSQAQELMLFRAAEKQKHELEMLAEKKRKNDLLAEKLSSLSSVAEEKEQALAAADEQLEEMERARRLLREMQPQLLRLEAVRERLGLLEPRKKRYEDLLRSLAEGRIELQGCSRLIAEGEENLHSLLKDRALLQEVEPQEKEHQELQLMLMGLEELQERHRSLQSSLREEGIRLTSAQERMAKTDDAVRDLLQLLARREMLLPLQEENEKLETERAELLLRQQRLKEKEELMERRSLLQEERARLEEATAALQQELAGLGDLEGRERLLRSQDRDLDELVALLNNELAELKGSLKLQELASNVASANLRKAREMGVEDLCPSCERPLGDQLALLLDKYQRQVLEAEQAMAGLGARIKSQRERLDGAAESRSRLKEAFEALNISRARRSELTGSVRSLERQLGEVSSLLEQLSAEIERCGDPDFDPRRLADAEETLQLLAARRQECRDLSIRLQELPRKMAERESLNKEIGELEIRCQQLNQDIESLEYSDSDYDAARARADQLRESHGRFLILSQKVLEIPKVEKKMALHMAEAERLSQRREEMELMLGGIEFDPQEHEQLLAESISLSPALERSRTIKVHLAAEPEISRRRQEAWEALAGLKRELSRVEEDLRALGYSQEEHLKARSLLAEAEESLRRGREDLSLRKVRLGVLENDKSRLENERHRKRRCQEDLTLVIRRREVVEVSRELLNRFMDQVLIRIKKDIARTAGEILEEVSDKYSLLKIDDDFNIMVEDGGDYYPITRFSGGEIDMIAVSVRVAISEYLMRFSQQEASYSFLILDEIFGSQDIEHREKMISMLRSLEERFPQIIAISHISDVQGQFDTSLQVSEDGMGNSRIEVL